jgi:two-component system sensor histidine kinase PilS (NtrC family)
LISEFLDFAKPEKPPTEMANLSSILKEVVESSRLSHGQGVQIETDFDPNAQVLGHKDKLKQAFLNIVINGIQALNGSEKQTLQVQTSCGKGQVIVRIRDSGCGMSAEAQKRIFEPFHTTKPKGTGLGLAITHKILEAHSAHIYVESKPGLGTMFVISFPAKTFENQRPAAENKL